MIRDQHDYRVALFDAKGRKLTGRSYSALVEPVFEYFGADDIHPFRRPQPQQLVAPRGDLELGFLVAVVLGLEPLCPLVKTVGHHPRSLCPRGAPPNTARLDRFPL